jgi:sulfite exporter TauE/SafE
MLFLAAALTMALLAPSKAFAHCDGMDGPVVKAAQRALATENVNLVLIWVQKVERLYEASERSAETHSHESEAVKTRKH